MKRPRFVDTSHLTVEQKCILAIEQALSQQNEYRVEELRHRLMKLSIMTLDNDEREVLDYWGEEWD